jgi:hypothetical protein
MGENWLKLPPNSHPADQLKQNNIRYCTLIKNKKNKQTLIKIKHKRTIIKSKK